MAKFQTLKRKILYNILYSSFWLEISINWHTKSQEPKKNCICILPTLTQYAVILSNGNRVKDNCDGSIELKDQCFHSPRRINKYIEAFWKITQNSAALHLASIVCFYFWVASAEIVIWQFSAYLGKHGQNCQMAQ